MGFTYYDIDYVYDYTYFFLMALLSIYGGMRLYKYISQVNLNGVHGWCIYDMMLIKLMIPFHYDDL